MSLAKARKFPSYGVGCAKESVTNRAPHSTLMFGTGASRHTTSGGLSHSGKVTSLSSRNYGVVLPCLLAG